MAINFNGNKVSHLMQNGKYVTSLNYDNKTVWAEKIGTYTTGTLDSHLKSLECARTASKDPSAPIGKISDGDVLYHGDTLSFAGTTVSGKPARVINPSKVVEGNPDLTSSNREISFNGVNLSGASGFKNITIKCGTGVSSAQIEYYNLRRKTTTSTSTMIKEIVDATKPTTWTATGVKSGYALPLTTGTFEAGPTDDITYTVSAEPYSWKQVIDSRYLDEFGTFDFKGSSSRSWFDIGVMDRYEKVRVSGTYKVDFIEGTKTVSKTGSFGNVLLNTNATTPTQICSAAEALADDSTCAYAYVNMYHDSKLRTELGLEEEYPDEISVGNVKIVITSVEAYVPFYFSDAFQFDDDGYGFILINAGTKPYSMYGAGENTHYYTLHETRYLNVSGLCDWSSASCDLRGVFTNLGTVSHCRSLGSLDATIIGSASDGQQSLGQYSLVFAISDSSTGYMVTTMEWVENIL